MKRILYTLIVLSTVWFTGCREDQLEGEVPGKEVALTFSSRSSDLSSEALSKEINALHLLIFNEDGTFSQQKEFAGLANVTPVKLSLGTYTFAYLSNIGVKQISGLTEGARLDDVVLTLLTDANGDIVLPGSIFSGTDKITVGEDKTSDAALSRMVGRLDIFVTGLKGGVELQSVTLLGTPKSVRFNGTVQDSKARLKVPMNKEEELMKGQAVAFPTCADSLARLEFVIVADGETKTYVSTLANKVEANKIHTINAKVNVASGVFDVSIEMSVEAWGASESEDITASEKRFVDDLTVKFLMSATSVNVNRVKYLNADFTDDKKENNYSVYGVKGEEFGGIEVKDDTLILKYNGLALCGKYILQNISIRDSLENNLYALPASVNNIVVDSTGVVVIALPKMPDVADADAAAMLELRDAMRAAGIRVPNWSGDNVNLWYDVEMDASGRVVRIGYSQLDDYGKDYDDNGGTGTLAKNAKASDGTSGSGTSQAWNLPESFKNLTELKCFNLGETSYGCLAEIPAFIKDMNKLEELSVYTSATTLPELPVSLKLLEVCSERLTTIPPHIANLVDLQVLVFGVPYDEDGKDENIDLSKSNISLVDVEFGRLTKLQYLYIQAGTSCAFPNTLWDLDLQGRSLAGLALAGFSSIEMPSVVTRWTALRELTLANDNLIPANIQAIKDLNLEDLMIYSPVFAQNGLPDWLGQMSTLKYLTLTNCGLTTIPESFNGLTNLEDLDLSDNPNLTGKLPSVLLEKYNNSNLYVYASESPNFNPDGITFVVTPENINAPGEGGEYEVEIETDGAWSCQLSAHHDNFVTLVYGTDSVWYNGGLKGVGNAKLKVKVKPGLFGEYNFRDGDIVVACGRRSVYIPIHQESATVEKLETNGKDSYSVAVGDSFVLDVFSNTNWYVETQLTDGNGHLYMEPSSGQGNGTCKGELVMSEDSASCTIVVYLRSLHSDLEKTITVTGYRAN